MIDKIITTDRKGNKYEKYRDTEVANSIVCMDGKNKHYRGKPNISIRTGQSIYGKEIVIQLEVQKLIGEYSSSSGFDKHIEVYFTEEQAKELFARILSKIGGVIVFNSKVSDDVKISSKGRITVFNPNEWVKDKCERCGSGHLFCERCNKYTWNNSINNDIKEV